MKKITKTEQKYLNFLFELKKECVESEYFCLTAVLTKHKISHVVGTILIKKGIIQNINNKRQPRYMWKTIQPNIHMARAIYQETKKYYISKRDNLPILTQENPQKKQKLMNERELTLDKIETIIDLRDVKNKQFTEIAKEVNYSYVHLNRIYYAAKGSEIHLKRLGNISKKAVKEYRKKIKVSYSDKPIDTVRAKPRVHPQVVQEQKQRSIVILWGLINIKF